MAAVTAGTFGLPLLERLADLEKLTVGALGTPAARPRRRGAPPACTRVPLPARAGAGSRVCLADRRATPQIAPSRLGKRSRTPRRGRSRRCTSRLPGTSARRACANKAIEYLLAAGDAAWALYADRPALAHYRRALDFMATDDPRVGIFSARSRSRITRTSTLWRLMLPGTRRRLARSRLMTRRRRPSAGHSRRVLRPVPPRLLLRHAGLVADGGPLLRLAPISAWPQPRARHGRGAQRLGRRAARPRTPPGRRRLVPRRARHGTRFQYAWSKIRRLELPSAHLLDDLAEAEATDDLTLEIPLHQPRPYFPYLLATSATSPWPQTSATASAIAGRAADLVTNGALLLVEQGERHALLRAKPRSRKGRGNVEEVEVLFLSPDEFHSDLPPTSSTSRSAGPAFRSRTTSASGAHPGAVDPDVGLHLHRRSLDDPLVRRAFAHTLDQPRSLEDGRLCWTACVGGRLPAAGRAGPHHRILLGHDPARARELLAEPATRTPASCRTSSSRHRGDFAGEARRAMEGDTRRACPRIQSTRPGVTPV